MKIKTVLITTILFFVFLSSVQAQDKYDFAIVTLSNIRDLSVTYSAKPYEKIKVEKEDLKDGPLAALLRKVSEMQNEGWEVFNTATLTSSVDMGSESHFFYLRKKQQ